MKKDKHEDVKKDKALIKKEVKRMIDPKKIKEKVESFKAKEKSKIKDKMKSIKTQSGY